MINYYEKLEEQKKQEISQIIQTFLEQTFILERTYDKKIKRLQFNKQYQVLEEYLSFVRWYFSIMGIGVEENRQLGIIYLNSDKVVGEKMSRLTTLYGLALKLLYDEQMSVASTTTNIIVKLSDINERLHTFGLLKTKPSVTEMKMLHSVLGSVPLGVSLSLNVMQETVDLIIPICEIFCWF